MDMGKSTISVIDKIKVSYLPPSYDDSTRGRGSSRPPTQPPTKPGSKSAKLPPVILPGSNPPQQIPQVKLAPAPPQSAPQPPQPQPQLPQQQQTVVGKVVAAADPVAAADAGTPAEPSMRVDPEHQQRVGSVTTATT